MSNISFQITAHDSNLPLCEKTLKYESNKENYAGRGGV